MEDFKPAGSRVLAATSCSLYKRYCQQELVLCHLYARMIVITLAALDGFAYVSVKRYPET
jgi:hypothetical protein